VIIGLWHGAGWNFVAWGLYNGLLIVGYQLLLKPILDVYWLENRLTHGLCILLTGLATSVGAILFRSTSLSSLSSKVILATLHSSYQDSAIILIVIAVYTFYILPLLMVFLGWLYFEKMGFDPVRLWGLRIFSYALVFLLIAIFSGRDQYDFIYFQF
jgi:alginate O-acetyltransferase complex protein AlgI